MTRKRAPTDRAEVAAAIESMMLQFQRLYRERFRERSVTPLQFFVLHWLTKESTTNAAGFARILGVKPQSITPILDSLETAGYVRRVPVPGDRRTSTLLVTPKGRREVAQIWATQMARVEEALRDLPGDELRRATEAFRLIERALAARPETAAMR